MISDKLISKIEQLTARIEQIQSENIRLKIEIETLKEMQAENIRLREALLEMLSIANQEYEEVAVPRMCNAAARVMKLSDFISFGYEEIAPDKSSWYFGDSLIRKCPACHHKGMTLHPFVKGGEHIDLLECPECGGHQII